MALNDLCACDVLEVLTQDPDVVENITMIVNRSEDRLITKKKDSAIYRLSIKKGA